MKSQTIRIIAALMCLCMLTACKAKDERQEPIPTEDQQPQTEFWSEDLPEPSETMAETTEAATEPAETAETADTMPSTEVTTGLPEWESVGGNKDSDNDKYQLPELDFEPEYEETQPSTEAVTTPPTEEATVPPTEATVTPPTEEPTEGSEDEGSFDNQLPELDF